MDVHLTLSFIYLFAKENNSVTLRINVMAGYQRDSRVHQLLAAYKYNTLIIDSMQKKPINKN